MTRLGSGISCLCAKFLTVMNTLLYALLHPKFRKRLCKIRSDRNVREYELKSVDRRQSMPRKKKVKVGNDQEKAQSERNTHLNNRGGKRLNFQKGTSRQ